MKNAIVSLGFLLCFFTIHRADADTSNSAASTIMQKCNDYQGYFRNNQYCKHIRSSYALSCLYNAGSNYITACFNINTQAALNCANTVIKMSGLTDKEALSQCSRITSEEQVRCIARKIFKNFDENSATGAGMTAYETSSATDAAALDTVMECTQEI